MDGKQQKDLDDLLDGIMLNLGHVLAGDIMETCSKSYVDMVDKMTSSLYCGTMEYYRKYNKEKYNQKVDDANYCLSGKLKKPYQKLISKEELMELVRAAKQK